jgi:hypothetical protein
MKREDIEELIAWHEGEATVLVCREMPNVNLERHIRSAAALRHLLQAQDEVSCNRPEQAGQSVSREGALQTNLLLAAADALSQYAIVPEYDCPSDKPIYVGEHCSLCGEMLTVQHEFSAHTDDCLIVLLTKAARSKSQIVNADFVQRCSDDLRASLDKFEERESATPSDQQNEGDA